ncbi:MAG: helix-hairpin-helix domain-containing protein, partial [Lachnospiraceae bacterium]|nr:helix-hairpin-helix domain-containing protein [Candidatus Hippenecus merdae]
GACDIIAEEIADRADLRQVIRKTVFEHGYIESSLKDAAAETADEKKVYEGYYSYEEPVKKVLGHRVLALNRGEAEKILTVKVTAPDGQIIGALIRQYVKKDNKFTAPALSAAVTDSYKRLIFPAIERDIRSELSEKAEDGAIHVFGENLKQLLMVPPIAGHNVLGWDPAFRTGCKLCVVDPTGKVLYTNVIYPTPPQSKVAEAKQELKKIVEEFGVDLISLGNGIASRESEQVICEFIKESGLPVKYIIVNEAGASVYSASKLATEEFPQFDVGQRCAASIARRLQGPLSELVKIEPKAIGVGQYQHDCDQKKLDESLHSVVEDCVNKVGVDLNTASASLLQYVSGINRTL